MPHPTIPDEIMAGMRLLGVPVNSTLADIDHAFTATMNATEDNGALTAENIETLTNARDQVKNYFKANTVQSSAIDFNQSTSYQKTSREYFSDLCQQASTTDRNGFHMMELDDGIPLDDEYTFYLSCPFSNPELNCNPYDFNHHIDRYHSHKLFTSLEQAQIALEDSEDLRQNPEQCWKDSLYANLLRHNYLPVGIIYTFRGCARVFIESFARGDIDDLIPLMRNYYLPKVQLLPIEQQQMFITLQNSKQKHIQTNRTDYQLYRELKKLYSDYSGALSDEFVTGDIPTHVVQAILRKQPVPTDYQHITVPTSPTAPMSTIEPASALIPAHNTIIANENKPLVALSDTTSTPIAANQFSFFQILSNLCNTWYPLTDSSNDTNAP